MSFVIKFTNKLKKDLKLCEKRGCNINLLDNVVDILQKRGKLPAKYKPHKLTGKYKNCWECHIKPDWLLVIKQFWSNVKWGRDVFLFSKLSNP